MPRVGFRQLDRRAAGKMGFEGAPRDSTTDAFYFGLLLRYVNALEAAGDELGLGL
jgi:hypothetical protein